MPPTADDELPLPPGGPPERWLFRGLDPRLGVAVAVIVDLGPSGAAYRAAVARPGRAPVVVVAERLARPRHGLELRGPGLWADHVLEEAGRRWTLGLEAQAVALARAEPDPGEDARGDPVPLGLDLDVEDEGPAVDLDAAGYGLWTWLRGEVLVGPDRIEVAAAGHREHRRGADLAPAPLLDWAEPGWRRAGDGSATGG